MTDQRQTAGTRSAERTITLTDAVVAIAMTLLVLPLVELAPEVAEKGWSFLVEEHLSVLLGFVLSFLVGFVFWPAWRSALSWATPVVFGLCALVSTVNADAGLFGLLLLVVVRAAEVATPHVRPAVSARSGDATALESGSRV